MLPQMGYGLPTPGLIHLLTAMRPGVKVSELQARGREVYRTAGVPDADAAVIFFHGLGLSHMDIELTTADGNGLFGGHTTPFDGRGLALRDASWRRPEWNLQFTV